MTFKLDIDKNELLVRALKIKKRNNKHVSYNVKMIVILITRPSVVNIQKEVLCNSWYHVNYYAISVITKSV